MAYANEDKIWARQQFRTQQFKNIVEEIRSRNGSEIDPELIKTCDINKIAVSAAYNAGYEKCLKNLLAISEEKDEQRDKSPFINPSKD